MTTATFAQLTAPSASLKRASPTCPIDLQTDSHTGSPVHDSANEADDSAPPTFSPKRLKVLYLDADPADATIFDAHSAPASPSSLATSTDCHSPLASYASAPAAPTMDLFRLPDCWLLEIMRLLDCRTLLQLRRTCGAAGPLVREIVNSTASSSTFLSSSPSLFQAFSDLVARCLSQLSTPPSAVILFLSPSYPNSSMAAALAFLSSRLPPHCRLVGCHGIGILGRDCDTNAVRELERGERAVSMLMMHLPGVDVQARFVDIKSLEDNLKDDSQQSAMSAGKLSRGTSWLAERLSLPISPSPGNAPSFVVLSSPVTTVSDVLDCLYQMSPTSTITGALASGGRPTSVGLLTRQDDGKINVHTYGIAFLVLSPKRTPPPKTGSADVPAEPRPSYPMLTGFASRGCKACSGVYRIVTSVDDVIGLVRQVQSLPEEDAQNDPLLHPEVMEQLVGGGAADREDGRQQVVAEVNGSDWDEKEAESSDPSSRHPMYTVGTPVMDVRAVFHQVMQRSTKQDGYINGLFIGISDEMESKEGRVLCDIVELQNTGIKIETSTFHAIKPSSVSFTPAPLSLQGKYMQLFELDPSACMVDLANRVRHLSRRPDVSYCAADRFSSSPSCASSSSPGSTILLPSGLLFTCSGRGSQFYARSNIDSSIVTHQSGLDVCGFCCNGEIGPPARSLQVHSWMQAEDRDRRRQRHRAAADEPPLLTAVASLDDSEAAGAQKPSQAVGVVVELSSESAATGTVSADGCDNGGVSMMCEPPVLQSYTTVVTTFNSHCR